ncbi:hypothetical protein J5J83_05520 [Azoarcus sp. L1K30]|uniref:COG4315 family predicted lipoprotein n=1 Tax=Azoarcus sp. L1K30 TaxID=2820277 RepID=UPI001B84144D|nr:hypothetical protein [Azoarcus sp. L1K30]MBR0565574.1 hypothetical protein [Azoarcus sp. L1K30]
MKRTSTHLLSALMTLAASTAVLANPVIRDGIVTDPAGRSLYVFDKDEAFKSHCEGACLKAWPAYTGDVQPGTSVSEAAKRFEQGERKQWAWKGKPLYYFAGDAKPGERNGDGSGDVWHLVRPAPAAAPVSSSYY